MGHVTQLCRKATELVSRKVEVNEAGELGNIWGDALWREGWRREWRREWERRKGKGLRLSEELYQLTSFF